MPALSSSHITVLADRLGKMYRNMSDAVDLNGAIGVQGWLADIISRTNDYDVEVGTGALLQSAQAIDTMFGTKADFESVYHYDGSVYSELTRGRAGQSVYPFKITNSTSVKLFIGADARFDNIQFWLSRISGSGAWTTTVEYWNGAWTALSITDATDSFRQSGKISWDVPTDWISAELDDIDGLTTLSTANSDELFYVRVNITSGTDNTLLLVPPRQFTPRYSDFTFNAGGLISSIAAQLRSYTNPSTSAVYTDLDEFLEDNPAPVRLSADFADLYVDSQNITLLAKSVFPDQVYVFGSYNVGTSALSQTGTYKLASASPNPTASTVETTTYSRGTPGQANSIDFAGTDIECEITTTLNGTIELRLSGYDHTGALQAWASGTAGWTININGTLTAGTIYSATPEDGSSRLLVLTAVAKSGAATSGVVELRTDLDRTPSL